jgi:uracil phosphoribosyltransferase
MSGEKEFFPNVKVLDHPLIWHKLTHMRDKRTPTMIFRMLLKEIALLMGYEITRNMPTEMRRVETPLAPCDSPVIAGKKVVIMPILRAALGMADGLLELMPSARVGHVGLYRDPETHEPVKYYFKAPQPDGRFFIVVDPMLATGNSAVAAVNLLNEHGVSDEQISFMALVGAPEGVGRMLKIHPEVDIFLAALDSHLNDHAYIVPGLGDAGDRLFGTR